MHALKWMLGALASFSLMAISGRELSSHLPVIQTLFIRSFIGLVVISSLVLATNQSKVLVTGSFRLHFFRNIFHFGGQYGWFLGIGLLPLAEVFALEFTVPIWTAIIAALFLKEAFTFTKLVALLLGIAGVLVIVRPGIEIIDTASLIVLAAAVCYAVSHTANKVLSSTEKPLTILFYMNLIQMPIGLFFSLSHWIWPQGIQWLWLSVIGIAGLTAHYCLTKAMTYTEVSTVVTLDFIRLPLIGLIGVVLYHEAFEIYLMIGGALMLLGNLININRSLAKARGYTSQKLIAEKEPLEKQ